MGDRYLEYFERICEAGPFLIKRGDAYDFENAKSGRNMKGEASMFRLIDWIFRGSLSKLIIILTK